MSALPGLLASVGQYVHSLPLIPDLFARPRRKASGASSCGLSACESRAALKHLGDLVREAGAQPTLPLILCYFPWWYCQHRSEILRRRRLGHSSLIFYHHHVLQHIQHRQDPKTKRGPRFRQVTALVITVVESSSPHAPCAWVPNLSSSGHRVQMRHAAGLAHAPIGPANLSRLGVLRLIRRACSSFTALILSGRASSSRFSLSHQVNREPITVDFLVSAACQQVFVVLEQSPTRFSAGRSRRSSQTHCQLRLAYPHLTHQYLLHIGKATRLP